MHIFENFAKARTAAEMRANLGDHAVPLLQKKGPYKNQIYTGMQSRDGTRGWRLDLDKDKPNKGVIFRNHPPKYRLTANHFIYFA